MNTLLHRTQVRTTLQGILSDRDMLPPLEEVGASCSMALSSQVSTGYPRLPGGSFVMSSYALIRASLLLRIHRPSSRMFLAALMSRS